MTGFIFTSEKVGGFPNLDLEDYCLFAGNKIPHPRETRQDLPRWIRERLSCYSRRGPPVQAKKLLGIGGAASDHILLWAGISILSLYARCW